MADTETATLSPALSVSGASCQGCVKKIRAALEPLTDGTEQVDVDLERQTIALPESIDLSEAAKRVTDAGYPAEPLWKPALSISGATCQGCARKIRKALAPMTGDRLAVSGCGPATGGRAGYRNRLPGPTAG